LIFNCIEANVLHALKFEYIKKWWQYQDCDQDNRRTSCQPVPYGVQCFVSTTQQLFFAYIHFNLNLL